MKIISNFTSQVRQRANGRTHISVPYEHRDSMRKDTVVQVVILEANGSMSNEELAPIVCNDQDFKSREPEVIALLKDQGNLYLIDIAYELKITKESAKRLMNRLVCFHSLVESTKLPNGKFEYNLKKQFEDEC